ncbi:MAG: sn-glycerol-3-phosphate-binding periplasmic protein UgpB precursor [Candidatus Izimaplasma bacterium HR2]|nr:MAG: sn-glycerol-3-phosphate-binding periplasmic protein UgpB precursor [Candidatus Izimaplasma bacterium HR2]
MKRLFMLLLVSVFTISLAGCITIDDEEIDCELYPTHVDCLEDIDPTTSEAPGIVNVLDALPTDEIIITFWHVYGQEKAALLNDYIVEFEALYPNVTINAESQGGYDELRNKTILAITSNNTPTMLVGYPDHVAGYLNGNAVIPLDDFILDDTFGVDITDFIDSYIEENRQYQGGYMYSLPYSKSTEMVVINKDIFDANETALTAAGVALRTDAPYTWAELDILAGILVGNGANQCEYLINFDSAANFFINSVRQWDGGYTNSAGDILVDNANTLAMLEYVQDRFEDKTFAIPLAWDADYGSANFQEGDSCMTVGSTAGIKYNVPTGVDAFEIAVAPVPQYDLDNMSAVQQGPNVAIMEDTTDAERLAAWLFITYITNAENTAKWSMLTGYLPVRYSGYDSTIYQAFLTSPDADYKYESMTANAAFLQIGYNDYDPAFAGRVTSSGARLQAEISMKALFAGNATAQQAIDSILSQLGVN